MPPIAQVWDTLAPLVYVVAGALLGYFGNAALARRQWRRQKQEQLASAKRQALERALACMDPIQNAIACINLLVSSHLRHLRMDDIEFLRHYNTCIPEAQKLDIPLAQRLLLPPGIHEEVMRILVALRMEVAGEAIRWGQRARLQKVPMLGLQEVGQMIDSLQKRVDSLRDKLATAYQDTFHGSL